MNEVVNEEETKILKITDNNGDEKEIEIIHFVNLESTNKEYLIYTENEEDANGDVLVYASEYVEKEDEVELKNITDQSVIKEITKILTDLIKD